MHRVILPPQEGFEVDHKDRNKLNNQKLNLRECTHIENMMNKTKYRDSYSCYKGVTYDKRIIKKPWNARLAGKLVGYFETEVDAAHAYDAALREKFQQFGVTNF